MNAQIRSNPPIVRQNVAVVADSVAQLPLDLARENGVTVIPFWVTVNGQGFRDQVDMPSDRFFQILRQNHTTPTTGAPSSESYLDAFRQAFQNGAESVLCLNLPAGMSTAHNAALQAAEQARLEYPQRRIEVWDTGTVTSSLGWLALQTARFAQTGASLEDVLAFAKSVRARLGLIVTLESLEYLARGGRVGRAAGWAGSLLHIRPALTVAEDGVVSPVGRVRAAHAADEFMLDYVRQNAPQDRRLRIAIMHGDMPQEAQRLERLVREAFQPLEVFSSGLTPVIGAHTGPGWGLAWCYDE